MTTSTEIENRLFTGFDGGDDRMAKRRHICGSSGGDDVAVNHNGFIYPHTTSIHNVIFNGYKRRTLLARDDRDAFGDVH